MAGRAQPVTRAMFAELVAEWRTTLADTSGDDGRPRKPPRRRWMERRVTLREAAELTGLSYNSLRVYRAQGHLPAEHPDGGWRIGALARWRAASRTQRPGGGSRWPEWDSYLPQLREYVADRKQHGRPIIVEEAAQLLGVEKTLARKLLDHIGELPHRVTDAEILAVMKPLIDDGDRRLTRLELLEELAAAGLHVGTYRAPRLWLAAGGRELEPPGSTDSGERGPAESLRWDKLLTQHEVAVWFRVSDATVMKARMPRADGLPPLIVPAKVENGRVLYDGDTLCRRNDLGAGPVRKGHPLAAELGTHHQLRRGIARCLKSQMTTSGCSPGARVATTGACPPDAYPPRYGKRSATSGAGRSTSGARRPPTCSVPRYGHATTANRPSPSQQLHRQSRQLAPCFPDWQGPQMYSPSSCSSAGGS